jgi:hypothetical protein
MRSHENLGVQTERLNAGSVPIGLDSPGLVDQCESTSILVLETLVPTIKNVEPWRYRRWVARMSGVISIAVLAFVTNWGLFRLRNWARWALTLAATLPVPALVCVWFLLNSNANPEAQESLNTADLTVLFVMSALSCPPLLFLMWSPRGEMVFSPQYSQTIRQTPGLRSGCSGTFAALAAVSAEAIAYLVLLLTVLSILLMLGLIRSI